MSIAHWRDFDKYKIFTIEPHNRRGYENVLEICRELILSYQDKILSLITILNTIDEVELYDLCFDSFKKGFEITHHNENFLNPSLNFNICSFGKPLYKFAQVKDCILNTKRVILGDSSRKLIKELGHEFIPYYGVRNNRNPINNVEKMYRILIPMFRQIAEEIYENLDFLPEGINNIIIEYLGANV